MASSSEAASVASSTLGGASGAAAAATSSPCAGCKLLRRKCQPDCVFAPYFPPDNMSKFAQVHRIFGASNVTKLLNELPPYQREDAVNSLAYEAEMRVRDPVYGCVGIISLLQARLRQLQTELAAARAQLARYQAEAAEAAAAAAAHPSAAAGMSFAREPMFCMASAKDEQQRQLQIALHGGDAFGTNGVYDMGFFAGVGVTASGPFFKPSGAATAAEQRHGIRRS